MDLRLEGKVAIVTGSTAGLGLASARALAAEGVRVVISGRRGDLAKQHADELPDALGVEADLTLPETAERLVRAALDAFGRLDILVGSTGGPPPGTALETPADSYKDALDLLVTPMVRLSQLCVPEMRKQGGGRIVFVTSGSTREPIPVLVLSNSVRMAVQGFAKTLARQVASDGITVNCVLPGRIATDRLVQLDSLAAQGAGRTVEDVRAANEASLPMGRYGEPAEFGAVVCFLCSEQAAYVSGTAIPVDGAALAGHW
jgi:3-oxoacyl-[acyl-carrier protein] reductase